LLPMRGLPYGAPLQTDEHIPMRTPIGSPILRDAGFVTNRESVQVPQVVLELINSPILGV